MSDKKGPRVNIPVSSGPNFSIGTIELAHLKAIEEVAAESEEGAVTVFVNQRQLFDKAGKEFNQISLSFVPKKKKG